MFVLRKTSLVFALFIVCCFSLSAQAAPIKWRVVTHQPTGTVRYDLVAEFCDSVTKASGGRLALEPYGSGMLFPVGETFDSVKNGTIQMASISSGFWGGKNTAFSYHAGRPGSPLVDFAESTYLYEQTKPFTEKLYKKYGITYLGPGQWAPPEQLLGVVPIRSLADLKGKRVRFHSTSATFFSLLGASVVTTAPSEVYTALQTKQVDLAEYNDWAVNMQLNLQEVVKYVMVPCLHYDSIEEQSLIVNPKAWEKLPADLKNIVDLAREEMLCKSAIANGIGTIKAKREWQKKKTIEIITIPDAEVKKARKVANEMMINDAKKNPDLAEYVKIYAKALNDLGYTEEAKTLGYK